MNIWFTSDTHFNHTQIIKFCNRPFKNINVMNEIIIKNWNSTIKKDDIVYHLGDFALGNKNKIKDFVQKLNGKKYLIKGNHDVFDNQFYRTIGFIEVYDHPIIIHDFIVLSHKPQPFIMNQMYHNIYGHIHNSPMFQTKSEGSTCVCLERWNYKPVSDSQIFGTRIGVTK